MKQTTRTKQRACCANLPALAINGRFLSQPISGVQRYGRELLQALDGVLARTTHLAFSSVTLWVPPNTAVDAMPSRLQVLKIRRAGYLAGHFWEQLELPRLARNAILISLTNSAPLRHRNQLIAIHDAAIVTHPDDFDWKYRAFYRNLYAGLRRTPADFISVSSFSAKEVATHFKIALDRISVISNAAEQFRSVEPDLAFLERLGLADQRYILAVGNRSRRKNLAMCEQALAHLEGAPTLVIAGGGTSRAFVAPGADTESRALILDQITDSAIKALYKHALCLVFPSRYEGFGLPPLEAMTCGCPVITSHAASMPEICGDAALYCDPDRPETIAANIQLLMSNSVLRYELKERGVARASLFSWERSARKLLDLAERRAFLSIKRQTL